jgi:hypothetical protein
MRPAHARSWLAFLPGLFVLFGLAPGAFAARPVIDLAADITPAASEAAHLERLRTDPALQGLGILLHLDEGFGVPRFVRGNGIAGATTGQDDASAAREHLARLAPLYRFDAEDVANLSVRAVSRGPGGGSLVTFHQAFDGVEVFRDRMSVLLDREQGLVAVSGFLPGRSIAGTSPRTFRIDVEQAISLALGDFGVTPVGPGLNSLGAAPGGFETFALGGESLDRPIRARRVLFSLPGQLVPGWYVELVGRDDAEAYVISAGDGRILFRNSLVDQESYTYRVWADASGAHVPYDGPQGTAMTPHPTGLPDFSTTNMAAQQFLSLQNGPISTNDPWLPPGSTETIGNNVDAYADLVAPDGFSAGDLRAGTTAPGQFDHLYDMNLQPSANPTQRQAAIAQLFYTTNFLHDWFYDPGFDEASGNAQASNYGRGGIESDRMVVEAQDYGAFGNANMLTPADGAPPRMQMYLFQHAPFPLVNIDQPTSIAGPLQSGQGSTNPASFTLTADVARLERGTWSVQSTTSQAAGDGLQWVRIVDLNGDSHPDLATANYFSGDVSVLLSDGAGGFLAAVPYAMGSGPYTVDAGDLNEDGLPDLVCANFNGPSFSVRLGTGGGAFGPKTDFATPGGCGDALIGLVDADAHLDVVTSNYFGNSVSVFLGNGSGGFLPRTDYVVGTNPNWVEMADLNDDGFVDLVTANSGAASLSVLLGTSGGFGAKVDYPVGNVPLTLHLGDLDGDGDEDAVTANFGDAAVAVLLGNGLGGFGAPTPHAVPANPVTVRLGDVQGDGLLDVFVCSDLTNEASLLVGTGDGGLLAPLSVPVGSTPYGIALGDVTGDGMPDLVTANFQSDDVTILAGSVNTPVVVCPPFPNTHLAGRVALVDRGGCTFGDKVLAAQNAGAVAVLVVNNAPGVSGMTLPGGITIPALMISTVDGAAIKSALLSGSVTVTLGNNPALFRDGTLDNLTVAHEWGHYLHHRLVPGVSNNQGRGMSEGWGDFVALLMAVREEDAQAPNNLDFSGVYGSIFPFALSNSGGAGNEYYFGARRYPYSSDMTRNPLTFRHIDNSVALPVGPPVQATGPENAQVHNTGEVWCSMLWECYSALLADDARLTFVEAQDRMRDYVVAGLKLTPTNTTFTEARDAMLAAALAGDPADYEAFCAAFARRGIGHGAVSPPWNSTTHEGVVESYTCASLVAVDPREASPGLAFDLRGPNPLAGTGRFAFRLPATADVMLEVFDVAGRRVATLAEGRLEAGPHEVLWTSPRSAGVYFARLKALGQSRVVRVVVVH